MKVLVCDDERTRCEEVATNLQRAGVALEIRPLYEGELVDCLRDLFKRSKDALADPDAISAKRLAFDDCDIAIIDNNLTHLDFRGAPLTAEWIAGYVRAFTRATYVISLNKNTELDFDLGFLVGEETKADLALNTPHLANQALWDGDTTRATKGFLPWYWPQLLDAPTRRSRQLEFVKKNLDAAILPSLGFPKEATDFISRQARGALSPKAPEDGLRSVTFLQVFENTDRSLPSAGERQQLARAAVDGNVAATEIIARSVAGDLDLWMRRYIASPQDALVDLPHLLERMPFLLGGRVTDQAAWNQSASSMQAPHDLDADLYDSHLRQATFDAVWTPRPAFWWPVLKNDPELEKRFLSAPKQDWPDVVFCEDISQFLPRSGLGKGAKKPVEFSTQFEGAWTSRFVAELQGINYVPRSQFASL